MVTAVEENNLCVWGAVWKRGWREQTNQEGELNRVKLSEGGELGKNGRWYI